MGKVLVGITVTNREDLTLEGKGLLASAPRSLTIDALVDTGAIRLYLRRSVIAALGLVRCGETGSRTTNGMRRRTVYGPVELEIMGRKDVFSVVEVDDDVPNLVGLVPLECLDFVVDPVAQQLVPNPEHGGQWMDDEFFAA